jgi:hypothetical protein
MSTRSVKNKLTTRHRAVLVLLCFYFLYPTAVVRAATVIVIKIMLVSVARFNTANMVNMIAGSARMSYRY